MKKKAPIITGIVLTLLVGLFLMLYPMAAKWYGERTHSGILTEYQQAVQEMDNTETEQMLAAAQEWNERLTTGKLVMKNTEEVKNAGYFEMMDVRNSLMGRIRISKIKVDLPIFHGVNEEAISAGVGHMAQSSLPIGGDSTHSVLSSHSGSSSPLFSDLELLAIGDIFSLEILGETLTYKVYDIETVLPENINAVEIVKGKDLCTLVTCTPWGINSHRLLVHGERGETVAEPVTTEQGTPPTEELQEPASESKWAAEYLAHMRSGVIIGIILVFFVFCTYAILHTRNNRKGKYQK